MGVVGEARRRLLSIKMSALEEGSSGGLARKKPEMMSKMLRQIGASVFFGVSSVLIITVNKTVLTTYKFPSFQVVGLGQITTIITVLWIARMLRIVEFPAPSFDQVKKIFPLPIFYVLNLIFGLGSTKKLNLPMFTVLRRFTLLFVSIGQICILDKYESLRVNTTLFFMVGGAIVAAMNDLAFDMMGYIYIFFNDLATAANGLYSKRKLNSEMGKVEILFYNALVVFVPALLLAAFTGDLTKAYNYDHWKEPFFLLNFFLSCIMGFVLMYSTILVTHLTSPLTLTVVGCIKNVVVTYVGMWVGGDYVFDLYNFFGINISVTASLAYSYFKYQEQQESQRQKAKAMDPASEVEAQTISNSNSNNSKTISTNGTTTTSGSGSTDEPSV